MKPFGWGWLKGNRLATRITINFVVSIDDMIDVLAQYAAENYAQEGIGRTLTRHQVEQVIRRHYAAHGEGDHGWGEDLTVSQLRNCQDWAHRRVMFAFPEQYQASGLKGTS